MHRKIIIILGRAVPLFLVCCLFFFFSSPPASAASFSDKQWSDFPFTSTTVGGAVNYTIDFSSGGNYTIRRWSPFQEIELGSDPSYLIEQSGTYTLVYYTSVFEYDTLFFTGAESSFSFAYEFYGGYRSLDFTDSYVYVLCFDADGNYLTTELFEAAYDSSTDLYTAHFVPRVPSGTAYVQLASALYFRIEIITEENEATPVVFPISTFDYSFSLPVDSVQNQQIQEKLDQLSDQQNQTNEKLDEIINGEHGFDSSNSDFSGIGNDLSNSAGQAQDAMSAGMDSLGSMMDSDAFQGTLTVLAAGLDAVFTGHEVTICGVTGNPFTLLTGVAAIAIILMLAMKFIFRKWGSGGSDSSGGESSDA